MSEVKWTKEPWSCLWANDHLTGNAPFEITSPTGHPIAEVCFVDPAAGDTPKANAERIVNCVNAMAGLSNAEIATMTPLTERHREQIHYALSVAEAVISEAQNLTQTPLASILTAVGQAKVLVAKKG